MPRFFHPLLKTLAMARHDQLVAKIEFLKAENEMLRRRLPKRIVVTPAERRPSPAELLPLERVVPQFLELGRDAVAG